jgi:predicted acetyltransferase
LEQSKLITPTTALQIEHTEMLNEWLRTGEKIVPFSLKPYTADFNEYIKHLIERSKGIGIPEHFVPNSTFWLVNINNKILGTVNIRHRLTDFLLKEGGHIGYGIRPSERKKGYATKILELALLEAKKLGINKALVTCDSDNIGSKKTILKNNGIYYQTNTVEGKEKLGYWIDI